MRTEQEKKDPRGRRELGPQYGLGGLSIICFLRLKSARVLERKKGQERI